MWRLIWMDDGCNLFVLSGASRRTTSQLFGVSGNMVNANYHFLICCAFCLCCSSLTSDRSSRDSMRSHYTAPIWLQLLFMFFPPFLVELSIFLNPSLCLLLEIVTLICVMLVFHQSQCVCTCLLISPHLWCQTTSADASLSWWCPPCEWQAPFPWRQRWSGARQT